MSTNFLSLSRQQNVDNRGLMEPTGNLIGERVERARKRKGWSIARLARETGVALNTIQAIEEGRTAKSKHLPKIAQLLEVPLSELDTSLGLNVASQTIPANELVGPRDLPVYGTTEAGEGIMVMSSEPVDREDRPASLANVKGAYGAIVQGDSMSPIVRPRDVVVVNPHLPPRPGDLCVFRVQEHGEFRSMLKEIVSNTGEAWKVRRYQPERKEFSIKKKDWPECHVVVTIHRR